MPKLLQINVSANYGSTGKISEQIGLVAQTKGWNCYQVYAYGQPSAMKLIPTGGNLNRYLHFGEQRIFDNEGLASRLVTKRVVERIKVLRPDIIQLHNIHDHYINYRILFEYLNSTDIPVVFTIHDFWPITGHCFHFIGADCNRWKEEGCHDCPMAHDFPNNFFSRAKKNYELKKRLFAANKNLHLVAVSQWVGDLMKESFLGDKEMTVIPNGIDTNLFTPTLDIPGSKIVSEFKQATEGKFVILAVAGRWDVGDKRLEDYIEMSKMLSDDEVIVLVGVNDNIKANLPSKIIGLRRTEVPQELAAIYTISDVLISLSGSETFGLTIVEAYACGTPAVVYKNTAQPSLITSETGLVARNKDVDDSYDKVQVIKSKGKAYYSENCIKLARGQYDREKCYEEYYKLYESLIQK